MNAQDALELIQSIRAGEFEDARIEVKRAQRGLPQHLYETLSAFANQSECGSIVLGMDESQHWVSGNFRGRGAPVCATRSHAQVRPYGWRCITEIPRDPQHFALSGVESSPN